MAIFASTTTSGYSDPLKALSIKALEQRQKDMQAQMAAQQPDAAMMATIPGGIGHVLGAVGDRMKEERTAQALASQRDMLAQTMSGIDWEKGPNAQQIAVIGGADPDTMRQMLTTMAENRRQQAQLKSTADLQTGQQGFQRTENELNRGETRATREQQGTLAREQMNVTTSEGAATRQSQRDLATQSQKANADLAQAERDVKIAENALDRAAKSGDTQAQIAAQAALEESKAKHGLARDAANNLYDASKTDKTLAATGTNLGTKITSDEKIAEADRLSREKNAATTAAATVAAAAADPVKAAKTAELEQQLTQKNLMVNELERAGEALSKGINTGISGQIATGISKLPGGGYLADKEQGQRTELFDNTMNKVATGAMSNILKGQSTDFEMKKFQAMYNNPNIPMEAKRAAFADVLAAAKKDREIEERAVTKVSGDTTRIGPTSADPLEGRTATGEDGKQIIRKGGKWVPNG